MCKGSTNTIQYVYYLAYLKYSRMSNLSFRDSSVVIVETGRTTIRTIHGLAELLKLPAIEVDARVGLRREPETDAQTSHSKTKVNDYLVGRALDDALATGQDIDVIWPFLDGDIKNFEAAEALWFVTFPALYLSLNVYL